MDEEAIQPLKRGVRDGFAVDGGERKL